MSTMNISLPEQMKAWVESRSRDGRYANSSDYVRDLIRRDQERTAAIAALQAEIDAGRESGAAAPFDRAGFMARMRGQGG
ncbi:type II toxin-antitoxin system ParD family antitoxin [Pseudooceanicola nanhaiensis]|jgi:antitoxin ParD1/3/4|uniref:type II toxin-antitoxin system ParD family antitoxin n=1 Tax=Pseudooceanicola TaxID=1679449 RepID=UPI00300BD55C